MSEIFHFFKKNSRQAVEPILSPRSMPSSPKLPDSPLPDDAIVDSTMIDAQSLPRPLTMDNGVWCVNGEQLPCDDELPPPLGAQLPCDDELPPPLGADDDSSEDETQLPPLGCSSVPDLDLLPPVVDVESDFNFVDSDEDLPPGVEDGDDGSELFVVQPCSSQTVVKSPGQKFCTCKRMCFMLYPTDGDHHKIQEFRINLDSLSTDQRNKHVFNMLRSFVDNDTTSKVRVKYTFLGRTVCLSYFAHLTGISRDKILYTKRLINEGHIEPPLVRLSRMPKAHDNDKFLVADAFFHNLYMNLSEPLANDHKHGPVVDESNTDMPGWQLDSSGLAVHNGSQEELLICKDHPFVLAAAGADGNKNFVEDRYLPPDFYFNEMFDMHEHMDQDWATSHEGMKI